MLAHSWNALRREPLVHFLALAALLFVAYELLGPSEREPILIDRARIDQLVQQQAGLLGRPLTGDERERSSRARSMTRCCCARRTDVAWTRTPWCSVIWCRRCA